MTNVRFEDAPPDPSRGDGAAVGDGAVTGGVPDDPFQPLRDRAVSRDVWEARGYVPYYGKHHPLHDATWPAFLDALDKYTLASGQRQTLINFARAARDAAPPTNTFVRFAGDARPPDALRGDGHDGRGRGLLMPKYPFPGEAEVLPQLRPEYAIFTGDFYWHRHDRDFEDDSEGLVQHLKDEHDGDTSFPADQEHEHRAVAKYLIPPLEKEDFWHDHADDPAFSGPKGKSKLRAHLRSSRQDHERAIKRLDSGEIEGSPPYGRHKHRRDKAGQHVADRLEILPLALDRLEGAERVYWSIEGTPKADAILSAILRTDASASVFDVPSVTLWKAPELSAVASRWLCGDRTAVNGRVKKPQVVIVPDNDWHRNPKVIRQAFLARERLRTFGVVACVAAPPYDPTTKKKLGVDDFLQQGGELDELVVVDREAPFRLSLFANEQGAISGSIWTLGTLLGVRKTADSILSVLRKFIDHGLLRYDGQLGLKLDEYTGRLEWIHESRPTFHIREDLRYAERLVSLGGFSAADAMQHRTVFEVFVEELFKLADGQDPAAAIIPAADGKRFLFNTTKTNAAAIKNTAARLGVTQRAVQKDLEWLTGMAQDDTALLIHIWKDRRTSEELGAWLGLSTRQVQRIAATPLPSPLAEALARALLDPRVTAA